MGGACCKKDILPDALEPGEFHKKVQQLKLQKKPKRRLRDAEKLKEFLGLTYMDDDKPVNVDELLRVEEDDHPDVTPLMRAAKLGHAEAVEVLLQAGASVNFVTAEIHENALMMACQGMARPQGVRWAHSDHAAVVSKLLQRGADVNQEDTRGWTAFKWSVANGDMDVVQQLLAHPTLRLGEAERAAALEIARDNRHAALCAFLQRFLEEVREEQRLSL